MQGGYSAFQFDPTVPGKDAAFIRMFNQRWLRNKIRGATSQFKMWNGVTEKMLGSYIRSVKAYLGPFNMM